MPTAAPTRRPIPFPTPELRTAAPIRAPRKAAGEGALAARLATLRDIAPERPVSVLFVTLADDTPWDADAIAEGAIRANVRATDEVVRVATGKIGIVLQGADSERASQVINRIRARLRLVPALYAHPVTIAAASGIGRHGRTLLKAATTPLPDCG